VEQNWGSIAHFVLTEMAAWDRLSSRSFFFCDFRGDLK
jgi:hypothetical protein